MMSRTRLLALATLACLAVAMIWQRSLLTGLRTQNEELLALKAETDRLAIENQDLPALRAAANRPGDAAGNDLLRLRGEVRQLRAQQPQLDRLRAENERLTAAIKGGVAQPQKFSETEGFTARESWSNAGFATPDGALQTFFWAVREGNLAMLAECVPPDAKQHFAQLNEPGNEQERDRTLEDFRKMISGAGIRIVSQESTADGKATVGIQAVAGGAIMKLQLRRYGNEWKLHNF
jgi:cell division protein FtsB